MHEAHEEGLLLEHEMTELLGELQRAVQGPTFSYRLEEVHTLVVRLLAGWTRYQRRAGPLRSATPRERMAGAESPSRRGLLATRYLVDFPYTTRELGLLFRAAYAADVERGGRYEAHQATISAWTCPWPPIWRASCSEASTLMGTWYFHWRGHSGLWQIELDAGYTPTELLRELGQLELRALGYLKHGERPIKSIPAFESDGAV